MIFILGVVLLVLGYLLGIGLLWTLGIAAIVIGALLWVMGAVAGSAGRPVPGHNYWRWPW